VAFAAASIVLGALPRAGVQAFGALAGRLAWRAGVSAARITRINLDLCFPALSAAERTDLGRRSLIETGKLVAEFGYLSRGGEGRWRACVERVEGAASLRAEGAPSRGTLLLVPHFGNWELLNLYLGREYGLVAMYEPRRDRGLDRLVLDRRTRTGSTLVPTTAAGIRALYRGLERGQIVALLPDQVPARASGVFAPFFGVEALTMTLPLRLARRTGARIVMASATRLASGRFAIRFDDIGPALAGASDVAAATGLNRAIEALIQRAPAQYQWEYRRFRRRPAGADPVYG
jgi:KDO2-lipid IV(A) lauroyltransferase